MKVLVTGATGFIGTEIIRQLKDETFEIVGLSKERRESKNTSYSILNADIVDKNNLFEVLDGYNFDAIIHCAGLAHQFGKTVKEDFENVNVLGTKNTAELAVKKKVRHLIILSSTAVYGLQDCPMYEDSNCYPDTFYAESKLKAEKVSADICKNSETQLTIFRLSPVLGEKGIGNVPRLINSIYKNRFIQIGGGMNKKSLLYVGDIAKACLKVLSESSNKKAETYNLSAEPITMRKLVSKISKELGKADYGFSFPEFLPKTFFEVNKKTFNIEVINRFSKTFDKWLSEDIYPADKFYKDYGFRSQTSIEQAIEKQCAWFLSKNK